MVLTLAQQAQRLGLGNGYTSVAANPATGGDASYLAYLRGLGLQESRALAGGLENVGLAQQQADLAQQDLAERGLEQRRQVGGSFEANGMYRSGAMLSAMSRQLAAEQRRKADILAAAARQQANIRQGVASGLATLATQRAEQEAAFAGRVALRAPSPTNISSYTFNVGGSTTPTQTTNPGIKVG